MGLNDGWDDERYQLGGRAVLVSLLIHILLALLMWASFEFASDSGTEQAMEVEIAREPAPKPKQPPPEPEAHKPDPQPQQQPEPPKPDPQKVQPKPQPEPPKPQPRPAAGSDIKPGPKPILQTGKLAKDSRAGKADETDDKAPAVAPKASTNWAAMGPPTETLNIISGGKTSGTGGPATQSERDFLLSQIIARWKRPQFSWPPDAAVRMRVRVLADGSLAPPFNYRMPYAPQSAINGYDQLERGDPRLPLLETLYLAIRVAQPLTLAPELKAKAPFDVILDFKLNDLD